MIAKTQTLTLQPNRWLVRLADAARLPKRF